MEMKYMRKVKGVTRADCLANSNIQNELNIEFDKKCGRQK